MSFILYYGIAFSGTTFIGIAFNEVAFNEVALNQNKISLNTGILLKSFLILRSLDNPFASSFLINLDFLVLHTTHFDNIIVAPFIAFKTDGLMLFVFSPHYRQ